MSNRFLFACLIATITLTISSFSHGNGLTAVQCGDTISTPGNYTIEYNLRCDGTAITISGSDIHLDLSGHKIECDMSSASYGIRAENSDNITIKNGKISKCSAGIGLFGVTESNVSKMKLIGNEGTNPNGYGIELVFSHDNQIVRNRITENNVSGIILNGSHRNKFEDNVSNENGLFGIFLHADRCARQFPYCDRFAANDNEIRGNKFNHNLWGGIGIGGPSTGNLIEENRVHSNGGDGIGLFGFHRPDGSFFRPAPVAAENNIVGNSALSNAGPDVAEAVYTPLGAFVRIEDLCQNTWTENYFMSSLGPETDMCFGVPVEPDDED